MKHAFLIMAHKTDYVLDTLLLLLDHPDNDIFLHMDKKAKEFDAKHYKSLLKHSRLFIMPRKSLTWGGYNLVECEIMLLDQAMKHGKYDYYHLLSGADLPIKPMIEIHEFFYLHKGEEFVQVESVNGTFKERIQYRHFFQDRIGRSRSVNALLLKIISRICLKAQKLLYIRRNTDIRIAKGPQWFSITSECAKYILDNSLSSIKRFYNSFCPDEVFIQTLLWNDDLWRKKIKTTKKLINGNQVFGSCLRLIDWKRGGPYIWKSSDFDMIIQEKYCLFARKFDATVDREIVNRVKNYVLRVKD